uniref:Ubiquitin-like domain-containing protein n=1 Tax=Schistocephalus solidus TaxID=70667 RepID=A0A183T273_SCHSO
LLTIPNYDSLGVNGFLSDLMDPKVDEEQGSAILMFNAPEAHITVLQRPSVSLLLKHIEAHFASLPLQVCLVYSGLICDSTGSWLLKDGIFKPSLLSDEIRVLSEKMVQTLADGTKDAPPVGLHIACTSVPSGGEWRSHLMAPNHLPPLAGRQLLVSVNRAPPAKASAGTAKAPPKSTGDSTASPADSSGAQSFCQRLMTQLPQPLFVPVNLAPHATGASSIRISHPCLYVFPEGSGQSSIFAIPGFSLMVNAGYYHNPKCWKMAQHLDNVDAVLQTHWGVDNLLGLTSTLPLMLQTSEAMPKATCLLSPPPYFGTHVTAGAGQGGDPMALSVVGSLSHLSEQVKPSLAQGRLLPVEVSRGARLTAMPKVVSLYYKAGAGSLDLYPLTPSDEDHADVRKLTELWAKAATSFATAVFGGSGFGTTAMRMGSTAKFSFPLVRILSLSPLTSLASTRVSHLSISALLVWTPARKTDPTLRILFVSPNVHQARVFMALDYLHAGLSCLRQAVYIAANAEAKKPAGDTSPASRPRLSKCIVFFPLQHLHSSAFLHKLV